MPLDEFEQSILDGQAIVIGDVVEELAELDAQVLDLRKLAHISNPHGQELINFVAGKLAKSLANIRKAIDAGEAHANASTQATETSEPGRVSTVIDDPITAQQPAAQEPATEPEAPIESATEPPAPGSAEPEKPPAQ